MTMALTMTRRVFLGAAATTLPLISRPVFAAVPGDNRLVVLLLRGGMDGLSLVQPLEDPSLEALRPDLALTLGDGLMDLDGAFGLHPAARPLLSLWQARELAFVHATASPYRSVTPQHFEAQDMLEAGEARGSTLPTGWLNRALSSIPRAGARKADNLDGLQGLLLSGPNDGMVTSHPQIPPLGVDEIALLAQLYHSDPGFQEALRDVRPAQQTDDWVAGVMGMVAERLSADARLASLSLPGFDTHADQAVLLPTPISQLSTAIVALRNALAPAVWASTVVLAITEFGRTVAQNAGGGTDHGTASVALVAGGTIAGGRILGNWPGLSPDQLYAGRDLMPTSDVRALAAALLHRQFDISLTNLGTRVFPGLDLGAGSDFLSL
ncbi:DUF1501 domain-containing protein [Allorhizobium pseudoryzae]|uniref:DUF1501 domain-containing protein n=1 Tax=Allorhizobium pseudoryzae TaxID=379684 RepID=UPI003D08169E